jgi:hypothetical protein
VEEARQVSRRSGRSRHLNLAVVQRALQLHVIVKVIIREEATSSLLLFDLSERIGKPGLHRFYIVLGLA